MKALLREIRSTLEGWHDGQIASDEALSYLDHIVNLPFREPKGIEHKAPGKVAFNPTIN